MATKNKSERRISLAIIRGAEFDDVHSCYTDRKQHVAEIVIDYHEGGTNWFSGNRIPRCYGVAVQYYQKDLNKGYTSFTIGGKPNPGAKLQDATRFSAKVLQGLADAMRTPGQMQTLVAQLYQRMQELRPEAGFPDIASDDAWCELLAKKTAAVA